VPLSTIRPPPTHECRSPSATLPTWPGSTRGRGNRAVCMNLHSPLWFGSPLHSGPGRHRLLGKEPRPPKPTDATGRSGSGAPSRHPVTAAVVAGLAGTCAIRTRRVLARRSAHFRTVELARHGHTRIASQQSLGQCGEVPARDHPAPELVVPVRARSHCQDLVDQPEGGPAPLRYPDRHAFLAGRQRDGRHRLTLPFGKPQRHVP